MQLLMIEEPRAVAADAIRSEKPVMPTEPLCPLTSLRFFGSLAVFFFHAIEICQREAQTVIIGSASAVSLFFVLSGFILVYIYQNKLPELGTRGFYAKRIARLWPLHVACLALVLVFQFELLKYPQLLDTRDFWWKLALNLVMLQNLVPSQDWALSFNGVAWFVGTEFCFCLLFPFFARGGKKAMLPIWLGTFVLLAVGLTIANRVLLSSPHLRENIHILIQCNPIFRLFEFTSGMLVGHLVLGGFRLPAGKWSTILHSFIEVMAIGLLMVSLHHGLMAQWMFRFFSQMDWPAIVIWLAKGGSSLPASMLLIWVLSSSRGPLATLLSQPLLVFLGKLSFSFYMIHSLILLLIVRYSPPHEAPVVMILSGLVFSIAAASILNLVIETPFRNWMAQILDRRQPSRQLSFTSQPWNRMIYSTAVACLVGMLGYWALYAESRRDLMAIPGESGQIIFGQSAVLHYVEANLKDETLEIIMVWEKRPGFNAIRFGHIMHTDGKFQHLPQNSDLFQHGRVAIERISIARSELEAAAGVGFGLLENGTSVPFSNRMRTFSGWRLTVYDCVSDSVPQEVKANTKKVALTKR
jgi:peptidoglycan/LPS O-acetylase OafA/YrhL